MKKAIFSIIVMFCALSILAQDVEAPKKGAKLYIENTTLEATPSDEVSFDVWLVRSKVARKANFENPKLLVPEGAKFTISTDTQNPDHYTVTLKTSDMEEGNYSLTIMGKRSGVHAVTGAILTLNVTSKKAVASKEGE